MQAAMREQSDSGVVWRCATTASEGSLVYLAQFRMRTSIALVKKGLEFLGNAVGMVPDFERAKGNWKCVGLARGERDAD